VFEVLRKDEEFILYRGQSKDDASQATSVSRLRTALLDDIVRWKS